MTIQPKMKTTEEGGQRLRATARGTVTMALAVPVALAAGAVLHIFLARALRPELYGVLAIVTSVIMWCELAGQSLLASAASRAVARAGTNWQGVAGAALRANLAWTLGLMGACLLGAPTIAAAVGEPGLTPYVRLMAVDIPLWVLWGLHNAILNGRRRYGVRALSLSVYWVGKVILVCGLVALGLSVKGAILGSIGASVVGLATAWAFNGIGLPKSTYPARELIVFGLPLLGLAVIDQLMLGMDLWCVKAIMPSVEAAGHYGVARYGCQAAMMVPFAVVGAMFPTLTGAIKRNNRQSIEELIRESARFVVIVIAPMIAIIACSGKEVISLVFGHAYAPAAAPLLILLAGALALGMRYVGNTVLVAAGRPGTVLAALAPMLPINIALNLTLVPRYGLVGAATATAITGGLAAAVMLWLTWRQFRVLVSPLVVLRTLIAAGVVYGIGLLVPAQGALVLLQLAGLSGLYLLMLTGLGELKKRDLEPLLFWREAAAEAPVRAGK